MLSKDKLKAYMNQLDLKKDYCKIIRIGSKNIKSKLFQRQFFEENKLITVYGEPNAVKIFNLLTDWTNIATFLIYISEFENIFYEIFKTELTNFNDIHKNNKIQNEFLDLFIKIRTKNEFYPLSEVKPVVSKISATDLNYIAEIIALRNYFAHGQKEGKDLKLEGNNTADIVLINDLDTLNKNLKDILKKLKR